MNAMERLWQAARQKRGALPILCFPAVQKMNVTVDEMVHSAELQACAMEIIARESETLAVVSPMDLSLEAEAFGAQVRFFENEVPAVTGRLVSDMNQARKLAVPPVDAGRTGLSIEALRLARQRIGDKPLLAGMIGPVSLAGRLMDVTEIIYACYDEPETVHAVLEKATEFLIAYGCALREAGADGLLMAEPLAGVLRPDLAEEFSAPYVKRIIAKLQRDDFAIIYHNCGGSAARMLDVLLNQGASALHFGNAVDMKKVLAAAPESVLVMGNVDPSGCFTHGTAEDVQAAVRQLLQDCAPWDNFVLSSGCDIPAQAPWENIDAFFAAARNNGGETE